MKAFLIYLFQKVLKSNIDNKAIKNKTHEGIYKTLEEVECKTNYDNVESLEATFNETIGKLQKAKKNSLLPKSEILSPINNLLPLLMAIFKHSKNEFSILDFGGGMATSYIDCLNSMDIDNVKYYIIDLKETIDFGKRLFSEKVIFLDSIEDVGGIDIVYIGSVLQYIDDFPSLLEKLIQKNPSYIFLANHRFGKAETYFTVQVNMPGRRIPIKIIQLEKIISIFEKNDYPLIYKSVNHQPYHQFENIPEEYRVKDSCNLLFARRNI